MLTIAIVHYNTFFTGRRLGGEGDGGAVGWVGREGEGEKK